MFLCNTRFWKQMGVWEGGGGGLDVASTIPASEKSWCNIGKALLQLNHTWRRAQLNLETIFLRKNWKDFLAEIKRSWVLLTHLFNRCVLAALGREAFMYHRQQNILYPKSGHFCENNILKLLIWFTAYNRGKVTILGKAGLI